MIRYSFNFVTLSLTGVKMSIFFTFADNFDSQECTVLAFISVSLTQSLLSLSVSFAFFWFSRIVNSLFQSFHPLF